MSTVKIIFLKKFIVIARLCRSNPKKIDCHATARNDGLSKYCENIFLNYFFSNFLKYVDKLL